MITIYVLTRTPFALCAARVLYKALQTMDGNMAVLCDDMQECAVWDKTFWTFNPEAFLPHGTVEDDVPDQQPVLLSDSCEKITNNAKLLLLSKIERVSNWEQFKHYVWLATPGYEAFLHHLPAAMSRRVFLEEDTRWRELKQ